MAEELPGLHHCIGTARTVTEIIFRTLHIKCVAEGGTLSLDQLDHYHSQVIDSFSFGYDLFELKHHNCTVASMSTAAMPFARDKILATLLRACGEQSAFGAFSLQVSRLGMEWIDEFFDSLAKFVRQHADTDIDGRLIKAYVDAAMIPRTPLTIKELLKQDEIKVILLESVITFQKLGSPQSIITCITDWVNECVAERRHVGSADICKVTESEIGRFFTLWPLQVLATLDVTLENDRFAEPAVSIVPTASGQLPEAEGFSVRAN